MYDIALVSKLRNFSICLICQRALLTRGNICAAKFVILQIISSTAVTKFHGYKVWSNLQTNIPLKGNVRFASYKIVSTFAFSRFYYSCTWVVVVFKHRVIDLQLPVQCFMNFCLWQSAQALERTPRQLFQHRTKNNNNKPSSKPLPK